MGDKKINLVRAKNEYHTYDPDYGDEKVCECGHLYHQHFGGVSDNEKASKFCPDIGPHYDIEVVECRYCKCKGFTEKVKTLKETPITLND